MNKATHDQSSASGPLGSTVTLSQRMGISVPMRFCISERTFSVYSEDLLDPKLTKKNDESHRAPQSVHGPLCRGNIGDQRYRLNKQNIST